MKPLTTESKTTVHVYTKDQFEVLAKLREYPVRMFKMGSWFYHDGVSPIIKGIACFTCVAGWTCTDPDNGSAWREQFRLRTVAGPAGSAARYEMDRIIHWSDHYKRFKPPFSKYGDYVPKAVIIDAVERVFRGERITA